MAIWASSPQTCREGLKRVIGLECKLSWFARAEDRLERVDAFLDECLLLCFTVFDETPRARAYRKARLGKGLLKAGEKFIRHNDGTVEIKKKIAGGEW